MLLHDAFVDGCLLLGRSPSAGKRECKAPEGVLLFHDVKKLLAALPAGESFVIGGEHMYRELLPYADTMYITEIEEDFEGDAYFPDFDPFRWKLEESVEGEGKLPHRFCTYRKVTGD